MTATANENETARDVLFKYVMNPKYSFYWYHNPKRINDYNKTKEPINIIKTNGVTRVVHKHLYDFFKATLDEVRLKEANKFATFALKISDNGLLAYFREAASKREFGADIDFKMQRDHATHTLYNYILGWYLFDCSELFSTEFKNHLDRKRKKILPNNSNSLTNAHIDKTVEYDGSKYGDIDKNTKILANEFGDVWSITSLLHDIGYILEGSISPASIEVENVRISRGSKLIHDYFNHRFWYRTHIDFRAVQNIAAVLKVSIPDFRRSQSLSSLGDHLCNIGFCENIRENLEMLPGFDSSKDEGIKAIIKATYGLNRNAFSLWETYNKVYADKENKFYKENNKTKMEFILDIVKFEYNDAIWKGTNQGYRNLNHGVCSGLIVLKALSFFYDFIYGFEKVKTWEDYLVKYQELINKGHLNEVDVVSEHSYNEIKSFMTVDFLPQQIQLRYKSKKRNADFWFDKVLWATASVAIHDVIQQKYYETICKKRHEKKEVLKISINDDPLAFLGILVDVLQEWDRYTVLGESAFTDKEPLQSTEVQLKFKDKYTAIHINYPAKNGSKSGVSVDIHKVLNGCLEEWEKIVTCADILFCPHCGEPLKEEDGQSKDHFKSSSCNYETKDGKVIHTCENME